MEIWTKFAIFLPVSAGFRAESISRLLFILSVLAEAYNLTQKFNCRSFKMKEATKPDSANLSREFVCPTQISRHLICSVCYQVFRNPLLLDCEYTVSFQF